MSLWLADRSRRRDERRVRAVVLADLPQTMQDHGDIGAEDAPVLVTLIDSNQFQVPEESSPMILMMLQYREMQHVRVRQHQLNFVAYLGTRS